MVSDKGKTRATSQDAGPIQTSGNDSSWVEQHNGAGELETSDESVEVLKPGRISLEEESEGVHVSSNDAEELGADNGAQETPEDGTTNAPPLPAEELPPLPNAPPLPEEPLPTQDDGWEPVWESTAQAYYFYNRFTQATQWDNPRIPEQPLAAPGTTSVDVPKDPPPTLRPAGGYDPAIHGDYDPTAWYAQPAEHEPALTIPGNPSDPAAVYAATGAFNRFTGRWQAADVTPENYNDENKSKRQMNAFFDVDAAANSHDGKSLKAERSGKKLSKAELKQFKEKRKNKKEEKRRAWLLD